MLSGIHPISERCGLVFISWEYQSNEIVSQEGGTRNWPLSNGRDSKSRIRKNSYYQPKFVGREPQPLVQTNKVKHVSNSWILSSALTTCWKFWQYSLQTDIVPKIWQSKCWECRWLQIWYKLQKKRRAGLYLLLWCFLWWKIGWPLLEKDFEEQGRAPNGNVKLK